VNASEGRATPFAPNASSSNSSGCRSDSSNVAALATLCVILPIEIFDIRTALRSESLTVGDEDRQNAGECK
jgi:hypothetical protein